VGDLLGPTLENLEHLVRMPTGYGEQNMVGFTPNIHVMKYLEATNQGNNETRADLLRYMKRGYQRELNYKHKDGSYSAFGESDDSGSTWLSAFVLKSYAQAADYIDVDPAELLLTRGFLTSLQNVESGCFRSVGKVFHKGMKGGIGAGGNSRLLAAYIVVSLIEAGEPVDSTVIQKAMFCVRGGPTLQTSQDSYEMAQVAYALARANMTSEAEEAIQALLQLASGDKLLLSFTLPPNSGKGVGVETVGYAMLAMSFVDKAKYKENMHMGMKFISQQRNSQGGFVSTQDTVVALESIAINEEGQDNGEGPLDLTISVLGSDFVDSFNIIESNKLLSQRIDVPTIPNTVEFDMSGSGCALLQGVVKYNIKTPEPSEAFNITVETDFQGLSCKIRTIKTCAKYLLRDGVSNMAIIEVNVVSGNLPQKQDLQEAVRRGGPNVKRYEVDGNKVQFYIDELTLEPTCVEFGVKQESVVEDAKPGTVSVYDYYSPELSLSMDYKLPDNSQPWRCPVPPTLPPIVLPVLNITLPTIPVRPPLPPLSVLGLAPLPVEILPALPPAPPGAGL